ncbi:hypothetical protein WA588_000097, partial [Blastocystis sp. NMH]
MDELFDNILNSKDRESEKRPYDVAANDDDSKRPHTDDESEEEEEEEIDINDIDLDQISKEDIDKMLAEADKMDAPQLDLSGIKRELLHLERAINENQKLRLKYASDPSQFEDSEYKLHEQIKRCSVFATETKIYPTLVELNFVDTIVYLLSHDNILIIIETTKLLDDLTDDNTILNDRSGNAIQLIDALIAKDIPKMLISNLPRLDKESSLHQEGVDSTVNTLSHLLELHPSLLTTYWSTDLYSQLLDRLDVESLDETSLACSELLFSLASDSGAIDAMAQKPELVDRLLVLISRWRSKDPETATEAEIVENLFNVLCLFIESPTVLPVLREKELMDLLIIPVRKRSYARVAAFKAIDYLLSNGDSADAEAFVEKKGLKFIFTALMGKNNGEAGKSWTESDKMDFESHLLSILAKLLQLPPESIAFKRVMKKFHDDDYEKCDAVLEIAARFIHQKQRFDEMVEKGELKVTKQEEEEGITEEEKILEKKIELGLHVYDLAIQILQKLTKDEPCNWHIQRKMYEQGWKFALE